MGIGSDFIKNEYNLYKDIYKMDEYFCSFDNVPIQLFEHIQMREYFVIVAPFTIDRKHFVIPYVTARLAFQGDITEQIKDSALPDLLLSCRHTLLENGNYVCINGKEGEDFSATVDDQCEYRFPSGNVDRAVDNSILHTVRRVIQKNMLSEMAGDILPLVTFTNRFTSIEGKVHFHKGIGFSCKLRMTGEKFREINSKRGRRLSGIFINTSNNDLQYFAHNWDFLLMKEALKHSHSGPIDEYEGEITSSAALSIKYFIHNYFVKMIFRAIKPSKKNIDTLIFDEIKTLKEKIGFLTYLDVSAGDDSSSLKVADFLYPEGRVIANDVSWESLVRLNTKNRQRLDNIYYTSHGASEFSYKQGAIDLSICKNTLHHTRDHEELKSIISNLLNATNKTIILVDVDNPCRKRGIPCLINYYYRVFLDDQGDNFLSEKQFRAIFEVGDIRELINKHGFNIDIQIIKATFGNSMIAILRKN